MSKPAKKAPARARSSATRALIKESASVQGIQRTEEVVSAVRTAMSSIEDEITAHDGIYPGNKGALSFNEVARRAGIHNTTLYDKERYGAFKSEVNDWLKSIKATAVTGRMKVRRAVTERVSEWKELYEGLVESHRISELDLQQAQRKLEESEVKIRSLEAENAKLQAALGAASKGKVVNFSKTKD